MQLFNSLDPSPFHATDLDDDAVKYLVGTALEFPLKTPLRLRIQVPPEAVTEASGENIGRAIHNLFEYQEASTALRRLRVHLVAQFLLHDRETAGPR